MCLVSFNVVRHSMVAVFDIFSVYFDLIARTNLDLDWLLGSSPFGPDAPGSLDGLLCPKI